MPVEYIQDAEEVPEDLYWKLKDVSYSSFSFEQRQWSAEPLIKYGAWNFMGVVRVEDKVFLCLPKSVSMKNEESQTEKGKRQEIRKQTQDSKRFTERHRLTRNPISGRRTGSMIIWENMSMDRKKQFPFIKIVNGPQLACDGWKGSYHMKDIFLEEPTEKAKKLLVVIDEDDKLFEPMVGSGGTDFSRAIQNEFLKVMDGEEVTFLPKE